MGTLASQPYLDSFINHEIHLGQVQPSNFRLDRVQQLLKEIGNPQEGLKVVHVAGTKGKGSVCAIISNILRHAGHTVGLYTSPHINNYRERIRVLEPTQTLEVRAGGDIFPDCISEQELCAAIDEIKPAVEKVQACADSGSISFFEVYTVLAIYYFRKRSVDFVVLETGMGGRLDATNTVESIIAVITPISLEHTRILGATTAEIAEEKAGIIKNSKQKVVIAPQTPEVKDVLGKRCQTFHIEPLHVESTVTYNKISQNIDGQTFDLTTARAAYKRISLPLIGKHQRENAATSICAIECLQSAGYKISAEAIRTGCENIFWPGRLEVAGRDPVVLLDGAHNPASAKVLSETVREIFGGKKIILVLGVSKDKNKDAIYEELRNISREIILTKANHPRAAALDGAVDVAAALKRAKRAASSSDIILVTGSIFVVSEARDILLNGKREDRKLKIEC
ncbi:MAG: bifunctional folylpolyglutamate synthase/dihydrofolate synthase [Candidatus Omnitrophica bacterium]|nr:bifunctional folylpolyglutamate synthase/dihydrofolate synthase [Candidatus Omnitrophota bacterium]